MTEAKKVTLKGRLARANAVNLATELPDGWTATFAPPKRTPPQNDHIHPLVRAIAKVAGRTDEDQLRALLVEQWRADTGRPQVHVSSLDGLRLVDVSNSTKALPKESAREFIDWLYAFAAEHGVEFDRHAPQEPARAD